MSVYSLTMINVLDIETFEKNEKVIPYCLCLLLNGEERVFYKDKNNNVIKDFLYFVYEKSLSNYIEIFAHNLNFDGTLIIEYLSASKSYFEIKSLNTNLYWIKIKHLTKVIVIRCSFKIIPLSLKKIGIMENFPKSLFPYKFVSEETLSYIGMMPEEKYWNKGEYAEFKTNFSGVYSVRIESISYCLNDIRLLNKCLMSLLDVIKNVDENLISSSFSAPSMSHKIFFKYFNVKKINEKSPKEVDLYARKSFKGGRSEVFGNLYENEHIKYYDYPGMYGGCMKEKFHFGKSHLTSVFDIDEVGFHTVTYKTNNDNIPILPRHSETGKLMFVNGENTDTIWFEELIYFIENGGQILKKHHSLKYENFGETFTEFVDYFENIKKKEGYYKVFGKLMINSLYGSMALKDENYYSYITFSYNEFEYINKNLNVYKFYSLNDVYIILIIKDYKFKSIFKNKIDLNKSSRNVTYSSAIASKARIKLHKFFKEVEKDGGRILYTDTDSIFAAYDKKDKRCDIGAKKWIKFFKDGVFASPKSYALLDDIEETIKIKGISFKDVNFYEFKNKFYNNENIDFDYQKINIKKNFILNQKIISKVVNFNFYSKRIFSEDKKTTSPLIINQQTYNE